jgi:hypothetical protein
LKQWVEEGLESSTEVLLCVGCFDISKEAYTGTGVTCDLN